MRKMIRLLTVFAAVVLLSGCSSDERGDGMGCRLFCVNMEGTALAEQGYSPDAESGEALVKELLNAMAGEISAPGCASVFPEGLSVKVSTLKDGRLTLDFNAVYRTMDHVQEILFRAAVVQTMTQCADVQEVVFTIEGEALLDASNEAVGPMQSSSFINSEESLSRPFEHQSREQDSETSGNAEEESSS